MQTRPALMPALTAALLLASAAGCFGLPDGAADTGDTVTVRYSAFDEATGTKLRDNRTATFAVGSGASGLGLAFEREVRGRVQGENFSFAVQDDPSLRYGAVVEVDRDLAAIPMEQDAPREEFDATPFGPAEVGKTFAAYGIYTGTVTGVTNDTVTFRVTARENQEDPVPSVGAVLVTTSDGTHLQRSLRPTANATFTIQPPSPFNPSTPLGLEPGSYRVLGATDDRIRYEHSASTAADLIGKQVRYTVSVVRITAGEGGAEPVDGNYGVRDSPQVNGDPHSVGLGDDALADDGHDDHSH